MELDIEKIGDLSPSQLSEYISMLIETDQPKLVNLLYRLDVDEEKIRTTLLENPPQNAGDMLTILIIQRLDEREKIRKMFNPVKNKDIPDDEKW